MSSGLQNILRWRSYRLPKRGNSEAEFEDELGGDPDAGCFAIADGATESLCADIWAQLLVKKYVANPVVDASAWSDWLGPLRRQWWELVAQRAFPWYAEHKLEHGAAAAFVGLIIQPLHQWSAVAIGDSCLFQLRAGALIQKFPILHSTDFTNRPRLIGSRPSQPEPPLLNVSGEWKAGDQLLLMTDALAQWFLAEIEQHREPAPAIQRLLGHTPDLQAAEIEGWRDADSLRNDDVSLILIEF